MERVTEQSLWIDGRRKAQRSSYENYFSTYELAKSFVRFYFQGQIERAEGEAEYHRNGLTDFLDKCRDCEVE